jgi:hypothetical protein
MNPTPACLSSGPRLLRRPASEALERATKRRRFPAASVDKDCCWGSGREPNDNRATVIRDPFEEGFPTISWNFDQECEAVISAEVAAELSQSLFRGKNLSRRRPAHDIQPSCFPGQLSRSKALPCLVEAEASALLGRKTEAEDPFPFCLIG